MKKGTIILVVILAILAILGFSGCGRYNSMVDSRNEVKNAWAKLQSDYQRRADLIPNLVGTVKGAADFEKSTYVQVAEARSGALKKATNVSADQLTPEKMAEIQKASAEAQNAARLAINVAIEAYPQLKANQNFLDLQSQLEGTENRIKFSRDEFNAKVKEYSNLIEKFPGNIFAKLFGFGPKAMFEGEAGADKAPKVEF